MAEDLRCPRCGALASVEHFRQSAECAASVYQVLGLVRLTKRTTVTRAGGRPKKLVPCPRCSQQVGTVEARNGHADCRPGARKQG